MLETMLSPTEIQENDLCHRSVSFGLTQLGSSHVLIMEFGELKLCMTAA